MRFNSDNLRDVVYVQKLRRGKDDDVISGVVEEGVPHTDMDIGVADEVESVLGVGLVVDPPVDGILPGDRRVAEIDVFRFRRRHITACRHA